MGRGEIYGGSLYMYVIIFVEMIRREKNCLMLRRMTSCQELQLDWKTYLNDFSVSGL